ncbi:hypothetical protein [Spirosoma telluris]|uniref:hypothetical protein n=1 Tax=Spirosoma telluris TaxID=2183553 RepID=UPI002FC2C933
MTKNGYINGVIGALFLLAGGCVDPYRPPEIASPASYLVVNGFFNSALVLPQPFSYRVRRT